MEYEPCVLNQIPYIEVLTPIFSLKIESGKFSQRISKKKKTSKKGATTKLPLLAACWFLDWLILRPEDGGEIFLRNVHDMVLYPTR
jgi:hypothetical protein